MDDKEGGGACRHGRESLLKILQCLFPKRSGKRLREAIRVCVPESERKESYCQWLNICVDYILESGADEDLVDTSQSRDKNTMDSADEDIDSMVQQVLFLFPDADEGWIKSTLIFSKKRYKDNIVDRTCNYMFENPLKYTRKHSVSSSTLSVPLPSVSAVSSPEPSTSKTPCSSKNKLRIDSELLELNSSSDEDLPIPTFLIKSSKPSPSGSRPSTCSVASVSFPPQKSTELSATLTSESLPADEHKPEIPLVSTSLSLASTSTGSKTTSGKEAQLENQFSTPNRFASNSPQATVSCSTSPIKLSPSSVVSATKFPYTITPSCFKEPVKLSPASGTPSTNTPATISTSCSKEPSNSVTSVQCPELSTSSSENSEKTRRKRSSPEFSSEKRAGSSGPDQEKQRVLNKYLLQLDAIQNQMLQTSSASERPASQRSPVARKRSRQFVDIDLRKVVSTKNTSPFKRRTLSNPILPSSRLTGTDMKGESDLYDKSYLSRPVSGNISTLSTGYPKNIKVSASKPDLLKRRHQEPLSAVSHSQSMPSTSTNFKNEITNTPESSGRKNEHSEKLTSNQIQSADLSKFATVSNKSCSLKGKKKLVKRLQNAVKGQTGKPGVYQKVPTLPQSMIPEVDKDAQRAQAAGKDQSCNKVANPSISAQDIRSNSRKDKLFKKFIWNQKRLISSKGGLLKTMNMVESVEASEGLLPSTANTVSTAALETISRQEKSSKPKGSSSNSTLPSEPSKLLAKPSSSSTHTQLLLLPSAYSTSSSDKLATSGSAVALAVAKPFTVSPSMSTTPESLSSLQSTTISKGSSVCSEIAAGMIRSFAYNTGAVTTPSPAGKVAQTERQVPKGTGNLPPPVVQLSPDVKTFTLPGSHSNLKSTPLCQSSPRVKKRVTCTAHSKRKSGGKSSSQIGSSKSHLSIKPVLWSKPTSSTSSQFSTVAPPGGERSSPDSSGDNSNSMTSKPKSPDSTSKSVVVLKLDATSSHEFDLICEACFVGMESEKTFQCNEGHIICTKCVEKQAKAVLSNSAGGTVSCPCTPCSAGIPRGNMLKALPPIIMDLLDDRLQQESLKTLAGEEHFVLCPTCDFGAFLDAAFKQFSCRKCFNVSCRHCKQPWDGIKNHSSCGIQIIKVEDSESSQDELTKESSSVEETTDLPAQPSHWTGNNNNNNGKIFVQELVQPSSQEWASVRALFSRTMPEAQIKSIHRVQNFRLWRKYCVTRQNMLEDNGEQGLNERQLFHGTRASVVDVICREGFDWRMCGRNGVAYGQGAYFAINALYSHKYATEHSAASRMNKYNAVYSYAAVVNQYINRTNFHSPNPNCPYASSMPCHKHCIHTPVAPPASIAVPIVGLHNITPYVSGSVRLRKLQSSSTVPSVIPAASAGSSSQPSTSSAETPASPVLYKMFLAKVLEGRSTLGKPEYRKPPIDPSFDDGRTFDSCVNHLQNPVLLVIFDSSQAYPEYIITYTV